MVEWRSPKPFVQGSNPCPPVIFYNHDRIFQQRISTGDQQQSLYGWS